MDDFRRLLLNNRAWVKDKLDLRADFFTASAREQRPEYLWIGCSDSRVPAEEVTGTQPGELFVHRNVANLVVHTDFNILSVLQFAVDVLQVKHIIVCGHYGCGGVKTAMTKKDLGLINKWLRNIKDVYRFHAEELDAISDLEQRTDRLVELNVIEQVSHISDISFVQHAWKDHRRPMLHGWVYDMKTGKLNDIIKVDPGEHPHDIYEFEFE
ncbi:MAG: carbonic anhydrase [Ignavibacteria bacterium]|nr:carbonic anhydrase [Ignavibacteria bacterium]MBP6509122.1 carbonic anhydrase [Candidatus Kapabacteria bacterium]MBK6419967.1 carbonic anhydrase [Ignavibacteria bacterium]MBK6759401.1 carbonic anhydrase [Ignavibacteria bacterium]MBK7034147.1 carbonic anhydrase [Ignavibacteria bacterium]